MKKLLLALALLLIPSTAFGQCTGVFAANQVCGSVAGGVPGPVSIGSFPFNTLTVNPGPLTVVGGTGFFTDVAPVGIINSIKNRLSVDAGSLYNGAYNAGNVSTAFTNTTVGADINAAGWGWAAINSSFLSVSSVSKQAIVGIATASQVGPAGGKIPIGGTFLSLNNATEIGPEAWGTYTEATLTGNVSNIAVGAEIDIGNTQTLGVFNIYGGSGVGSGYNTIGSQVACGGSYNTGGVFNFTNCSAALSVHSNKGASVATPTFDKGIIFTPASLAGHVIGSVGTLGYAINQGTNAAYVWWRNNGGTDQLAAFITQSDTTVGTTIGRNIYGLTFGSSLGGTTLLSETFVIQSNSANTVALNLGFGSTGDRQANINFSASTAHADQDATITRQSGANGGLNITNTGSGYIALGTNAAVQITVVSGATGISFNQYGNGALFTSGGAGQITAGTLPVANGGTNCAAASITCFNNITGFTAAGTTGTTSTNLVFSGSPTLATPTFTTSFTSPIHIGGVAAGSTAEVRSTSGTGSGDKVLITGGTNGATPLITAIGSSQRIGFGTETNPGAPFVFSSNTSTGITPQSNLTAAVFSPDGVIGGFQIYAWTNSASVVTTVFPVVQFFTAGGTGASPSVTKGTQTLGRFGFGGWATSFQPNAARISGIATATDWSSGANTGAAMTFDTTPDGSTARAEAMRLHGSGCLAVGTTTDCGIGGILANTTIKATTYVEVGTKLRATGTAPALTSCGTSPAIEGSDLSGTVTMGTGSPTGCVITFNAAYTGAPRCTVSWRINIASMQYTVSTTAITLTQTATSSNVIDYVCSVRSGG